MFKLGFKFQAVKIQFTEVSSPRGEVGVSPRAHHMVLSLKSVLN